MNLEKLQSNARQASILLKAMSNEHRLLILCQLVGGEKSVGELVRLVGLSQSALSQHLARLRRDNLVRTRREAQTIFYTRGVADEARCGARPAPRSSTAPGRSVEDARQRPSDARGGRGPSLSIADGRVAA